MSRERQLVSIRRAVAAGDRARYDALWAELRERATALGAHAWRFVSTSDPGRHLEFLEFAGDADPRADPTVHAVLERLAAEIDAPDEAEWRERP